MNVFGLLSPNNVLVLRNTSEHGNRAGPGPDHRLSQILY